MKIVPELQMPYIDEEFRRHQAVFNQYGCGWTLQTHVREELYGTAEEMPTNVEMTMLHQIRRTREQQEAQQRLATMEVMAEARGLLNRRLSQLDSTEALSGTPEARLREVHQIAQDFWNLGARRSGWMLLWGEYERGAASLAADDRLRIGLDLARMMLEDGSAEQAVRVLGDLRPIADAPATAPTDRLAFLKLFARTSSACCAQEQTVQALQQAIELETDANEKELLSAQLMESQYLHGDPEGLGL